MPATCWRGLLARRATRRDSSPNAVPTSAISSTMSATALHRCWRVTPNRVLRYWRRTSSGLPTMRSYRPSRRATNTSPSNTSSWRCWAVNGCWTRSSPLTRVTWGAIWRHSSRRGHLWSQRMGTVRNPRARFNRVMQMAIAKARSRERDQANTLDALWALCGERDVPSTEFLARCGVTRATVAPRLS